MHISENKRTLSQADNKKGLRECPPVVRTVKVQPNHAGFQSDAFRALGLHASFPHTGSEGPHIDMAAATATCVYEEKQYLVLHYNYKKLFIFYTRTVLSASIIHNLVREYQDEIHICFPK